MTGRINERGWIVVESFTSADGLFCVDVFQRPGEGFGFEHFRADPEDGGRWTAIGFFDAIPFDSAVEAGDGAAKAVAWLTAEHGAALSFATWRSEQKRLAAEIYRSSSGA